MKALHDTCIYAFISGFYLMGCDLWFTFGFWVSKTKTLVDLSLDESKAKIREPGNSSTFSPFLHYFMTCVKKMFNWILYIHNTYIMLIILYIIYICMYIYIKLISCIRFICTRFNQLIYTYIYIYHIYISYNLIYLYVIYMIILCIFWIYVYAINTETGFWTLEVDLL